MANLADGYYIVHSAYRHPSYELVLDKEANQTVNGTNIRVWNRNNSDAQIIRVLTTHDGTRRMLFRDCGKAVDVLAGSVDTDGTNIQVFDSNDTRAQQVTITATGGSTPTITWNGNTYDKYYIKWSSGKVACVSGTPTEGSNVLLGAETNSRAYQWFFEPIPSLRTGGSYRLLSMINTEYCLSIAGNSAANGANVHLEKWNNQPGQIWVIEEDSGKWAIRNPQSGRYMDVAGGNPKNGTNVQIWDDNDSRAQRWNFHAYGTADYKGTQYPTYTIGSYITDTGLDYCVDVLAAQAQANTNVQIWDANNTLAQLFMLVPTDAEDPTMPVPYNMLLAASCGGTGRTWQMSASRVYPTWFCSDAWVADGSNHYEYRWRSRYMYSSTNGWTDWSDEDNNLGQYTPWDIAYTQKSGKQAWLADGLDGDISTAITANTPTKWFWWKRAQYEVQVRSCGSNNYKLLHSKPLSAILDIYMRPDITLTTASFGPGGLRIAWSTDYTYGMNYVTVDDVINTATGKSIMTSRQMLSSALNPGYGEIELKHLKGWPADGSTIKVKYRVGYDQFQVLPDTYEATLTVNYNAGTTSVAPTFTRSGLKVLATVPNLGAYTACYVSDGQQLYECYELSRDTTNNTVTFALPYPIGREYGVFTVSNNADKTAWGASYTQRPAESTIAHAWSFDGGECFLHKFTEMPVTEYSYTAVYEADVLDARAHESLSFLDTTRGTFQASGVLLHDGTIPDENDYSTLDDFKELLDAHHAIYRDINGGLHHVGITGINVSQQEAYDVITVRMTEETV